MMIKLHRLLSPDQSNTQFCEEVIQHSSESTNTTIQYYSVASRSLPSSTLPDTTEAHPPHPSMIYVSDMLATDANRFVHENITPSTLR